MGRLTEVVTDTFGKTRVVLTEPSKNSICGGCRFPNECDRCSLYKAVKKLNALENILNGYDIDRLRELIEADREGRCVVLPVKVGDKIYCIQSYFNDSKMRSEMRVKCRIVDFVQSAPDLFECSGMIYKFSDFGKTVFRTREAAEAAVEAMEGRGKDESPSSL